MDEICLRNYAHLGDAVWELFVREKTVFKTQKAKNLHSLTTKHVCAGFQAELLNFLTDKLTEDEKELVRKAGNIPVPIARRNMQKEYRMSTSFEALIGWCYLNDKKRLEELFEIISNSEIFLI
ncbi:ribonuclease III [bacterium]|nr:ribonuclease III [bacterium]